MNNGITLDNKNHRIFANDVLGKKINVFKVKKNENDFSLEFEKEIKLKSGSDNIEFDEKTNKIYVSVLGKA